MKILCQNNWVLVMGLSLLGVAPTGAHMTPPVVVEPERAVIVEMTRDAAKTTLREVRLTAAECDAVERRTGKRPESGPYRIILGRDASGSLVGAVVLLGETTLHGSIRIAVGLAPNGEVRKAQVLKMSEEVFASLRPLLDRGLLRAYAGGGAQVPLPAAAAELDSRSLSRFYAEVLTDLVARGAAIFEVAVRDRPAH